LLTEIEGSPFPELVVISGVTGSTANGLIVVAFVVPLPIYTPGRT
jgi:hypothetical protein